MCSAHDELKLLSKAQLPAAALYKTNSHAPAYTPYHTVLLPCLGALPDALIVLNSGFKGSREMAQEQLAVGMGEWLFLYVIVLVNSPDQQRCFVR